MGDFFQELGEEFRDDFEAGVRAAFDGRVIFLEPGDYDNNDAGRNLREMMKDLQRQIPEFDADDVEAALETTDQDFEDLLEASQTRGPFALRIEVNGETINIINKPEVIFLQDNPDVNINIDPETTEGKYILGSALSGIPREMLEHMNLDGDDLARFIGVHEGMHLNEPVEFFERDTSAPDTPLAVLNAETRADFAAIKDLEKRGDIELAQAIQDWRALRAHQDPIHATSALTDGDAPIEATEEYLQAAQSTMVDMQRAVAAELGITTIDAALLQATDPEKFITTIEKIIAEDPEAMAAHPIHAAYAEDIIGAYRRQVIPLLEEFNEAASAESARHNHGHEIGSGRFANIDTELLARINEQIGIPHIAGNPELAARAAELLGTDPEAAAHMKPDTFHVEHDHGHSAPQIGTQP